MPDPLRDRIAEVLGSHRELPGVANPRCRCGWMGTHKGHEGHQADAVIDALTLKREETLFSLLPDYERNTVRTNVWATRYVTDWTADE